MASLEQRIRTAAAAFPALAALLASGSPSVFRWYDTTLLQGSAYPAVVVQMISNPSQYNIGARMPMSFARVQFMIWGGQFAAGAAAAEAVMVQVINFLDATNFTVDSRNGIQENNLVVGNRRAAFTLKDTTTYQRLLDVQILSDDNA